MEHQTPPASVIEPTHERRQLSENTEDGINRTDSKTDGSASHGSRTGNHPSDSRKNQSIPSLQERFAKGEIRGEHVIHVVQSGETLSQITMKYYGTCNNDILQTLKKINEIEETDTVQAEWELILPILTVDGEARPSLTTVNINDIRVDPKPGNSAHVSVNDNNAVDNKVSEARPKDIEAAGDPAVARFQEGVAAFEKEEYPAAYDTFAAVSGSQKHGAPCEKYLKEIEERAKLHFEMGLSFFRKRNYAKAIQEIEKACIPPIKPQATEYLFKSHFEIALKKFLKYKRSENKFHLAQAQTSLSQARKYSAECPACTDYEDVFKKTHYNNGIKYFTGNDGEGMDKAVEEWEKVRFIDPGYKEVSENIVQAEALLKKLKKIKKVTENSRSINFKRQLKDSVAPNLRA